jgi:hypothetical protein
VVEDNKGAKKREYLYSDEVPNHHGMTLNTARIAAFGLEDTPPPTGVMPVFKRAVRAIRGQS